MPKARRSSSRSSKKSHAVLWLLAGLLVGAGLMWAAQHYVYRDSKPFRGLANLFASNKKSPEPEVKKSEAEPTPKPKFDFYTILPEFETVLPEPRGKKPVKAEPPETGVSYILQAASLGNLEDADRLQAKLVLNGLDARIEKISIQGKGDYYRVRVGPYPRLEDLDAASAKLAKLGMKALRIKIKRNAG